MKSFSFRHILAALPLLALALPATAQDAPSRPDAESTQAAATAWGKRIYDIPVDGAVTFGRLENGLRYAILANATPEDTAVVRMGFDVGWVDETEQELGLAHVVEHMAFNGSTNIPEGEMIKLLERLGLAFGADTNASTGFEDTVYKLDLPRTDPELIDTALMLMRETASELTIADEAVDRERGVIQSETRTRNNYQIRRFKDYFEFVSPGTRYATRFRADGTVENIDTTPGQVVRDLYARFYRPDNAVLVVVGDVDPQTIEAKIRGTFADWSAPASPLIETDKGALDLERGPAAANFVDPDVPYLVVVDRFAPYEERLPTVAEFDRSALLGLGVAILDRRLDKIANSAEAPIINGGASASDFFDIGRQASLSVQAKEGEWKRALAVAEQEWRRAVEHGFTEAEVAEQLANAEQRFRDAARQQDSRRNAQLAENILASARREKLVITPQTRYELFSALKPDVTVEAVNAAFREHFTSGDPLIHVSTKQPIADAEQTILAAYRQSQAEPVAPPSDSGSVEFGYTDFGVPAEIVEDRMIEDLGIRTIRFANNVRLNLKPTDFEQGKLRYSIRIGSGQLAIPADEMASAVFLSAVSALGGLGKHSFDELRGIFAGRNLDYGFNAAADKFAVTGTGTMTDLPLQMKLSAAYFSDPGLRPEMLTKWLAIVPPFIAQADATPQSVAQFEAGRIVADGNLRFGIPAQEELEAVSPEGVRALIADQFARAPVEISVVGDFDSEEVVDAVAESFGALPERSDALQDWESERVVRFAEDRSPRTLTHAGAPDQALALTFWPTTDDDDAQEEATMQLLAQIMGLEMLDRIREELGASYSPNASSDMSDTYRDYGTFSTAVVVKPEQADEVFGVVDAIARDLRSKPLDPDLLERARKPLLEKIALSRRENGWWLGVADEAQLRSDRLDRVRSYEQRIRAVTPEMLRAAAQRYLDPGEELRIRVIHESLAQ